jgi:hypothetical protein
MRGSKFGIDVPSRLPQSSATNMSVTFADGLRACCVALGLLLVAHAAEPVSPLVGQTRDQILSRYGEPRSQIESGNRVIFFYPRERIVLRDNVVVEVEELAPDAAAPSPTPPGATPGTQGTPRETTPSGTRPAASTPQGRGGSDPKVEIKLVLPRDGRPASPEPARTAPAEVPVAPPVVAPKTERTVTTTPVEPVKPAKKQSPAAPSDAEVARAAKAAAAEKAAQEKAAQEKAAQERVAKKKKDEAIAAARRRVEEASNEQSEVSVISGRTYLLAIIVAVGGAPLLFWRYRQRQLDLAASSVENTSVVTSTATPVFTGNGFTADMLGKLDWRRFEELVSAYYSKTGVVAVRTKTGPESPVHIRISWKGEPRPFAYVQCIAHPTGLIEAKPLQALAASLAADDIRRGYVVTTGKFNVPARDFAEENHLTLMPGDIFLEKLNALPAAARSEIIQAISTVDLAGSTGAV